MVWGGSACHGRTRHLRIHEDGKRGAVKGHCDRVFFTTGTRTRYQACFPDRVSGLRSPQTETSRRIEFGVVCNINFISKCAMRRRCQVQLLLGLVIGGTISYLAITQLSSSTDESLEFSTDVGCWNASKLLSKLLLSSPSRNDSPPESQGRLLGGRFAAAYAWQRMRQNRSLYYFERPGRLIPMMRLLDEREADRSYRISAAKAWLRTQSLVVAATVRSGMLGLESSLKSLARLRRLFARSWVLIVENDSTDGTRQWLLKVARSDPSIIVLGCDTVNSPLPCHIDIRYASGKEHWPGQTVKRVISEEVDRGLIMSALRNEYLNFAYNFLADKADLMLMLDPDVEWQDWDLDNVMQGLYYFKTRPQLQQLCGNTIDLPSDKLYDPCTLAFFNNKRFGEDTLYPAVDYYKSIHNGASDLLPPVKVESCFQAFAFYRLSALSAGRLQYERSHGEWMCEHNTLSRQLKEVYIDPQMHMGVKAANIG